MGSIPLPALDVRPPEDPLSQYAKVANLRGMLQQQQLQKQVAPLQIQQEQQKTQQVALQLKDQQAMTKSLQQWDGKDIHDLPGLVIKNGGSANAVLGLRSQLVAQQKAAADADEATLKNQQTKNDLIAGHLENVKSAAPEAKQQVYDSALTDLEQKGLLRPNQIPHQYPGDDKIDLLEKSFMGQKQIVDAEMKNREVSAQEEAAAARMKAAGKQPEGENPLADVNSMNQALQDRFQVLNPGKPLPPYLTLKQGATQKDFDRADKILQQTEQAKGTKVQQDTANAMREQSMAMTKQTQQANLEQKQIQPVIGTDPKSGKSVLVSQADAQQMGIKDAMKAGEQEVTKAQAARHWIPLAEKQGDTPESMGILPLIDKLDKEGKLGVVASRWNDFMAGKVGAGDPDITALRTKMGLSTTLLMNAHVGNRGGSYMLEHFEDLANSKKMNAETLKAGVKSELDYVKDRAMLPNQAAPQHTAGGAAQGLKEGQTGTGSDGKKYVVKGGVWVPAQ